jgi:hypothetical protein
VERLLVACRYSYKQTEKYFHITFFGLEVGFSLIFAMFTKVCSLFTILLAHNGRAEALRVSRHLSNELIAGYEPSSVVTDHVCESFIWQRKIRLFSSLLNFLMIFVYRMLWTWIRKQWKRNLIVTQMLVLLSPATFIPRVDTRSRTRF